MARRLADVPFAAVHHSTVGRAAETASLIAAELPGVPVHPTDLLRECIPQVPADADLTDDLRAFFASLPPAEVAAGPGLARAALDRFAGQDGPSPELLVSHGNLINWFVANALGAPGPAWLRMLDYHCAITVILYLPGRTKLVAYNDMGHLPAEMRGTDYPPHARV